MAKNAGSKARPSVVRVVPVKDLRLDPNNPRLGVRSDGAAWDQRAMLEHFSQDKTVQVLAADIATHGINPTKRTIVSQEDDSNFYVVREGNRRLAALRLLLDPTLAATDGARKYFAGVAKLGTIPRSVECIDQLSAKEVEHWIELEHTTDHKGRGTVSWGPQEHQRFKLAIGGKARHKRSLDVLELLVDRNLIDLPTMKKVPITTLDRILTDRYVQKTLGTDKPDFVTTQGRALQRIALDLANGMKVDQVRHLKDRKKYIDKVVADPSKGVISRGTGSSSSSKAQSPAKAQRSTKQTWQRTTLIPSNFLVKTKNSRLIEVARELKKLNVEDFVNAASVMFRVILDIGLTLYIQKHRIAIVKTSYGGYELKNAVQKVCQHLIDNGADDKQLNPIMHACSNKHSFLAVEGFHGYVHSAYIFPDKQTLNRKWDEFAPLMTVLLS